MAVKKRKLVELNKKEKSRFVRVSIVTLSIVAIVCCILVGCFACKQDPGDIDTNSVMTDAQKADYWRALIIGVEWSPQTDATHDGILKGFVKAMDTRTDFDALIGKTYLYFLYNDGTAMDSAEIILSSESGELKFESDDIWSVKFSEKNDVMYMTVTDSNGKAVYYQQK